jgi:homoserine dehydrogenase
VQPELVRDGASLAHVDGTADAVVFEASPVRRVTITGPGAGLRLAGQES